MASLGGPAITAVSGGSASVGGSNSSSSGGKKQGDQSQGIGGIATSGPSRPSGMISVPLNVATLVCHTVISPYSGLPLNTNSALNSRVGFVHVEPQNTLMVHPVKVFVTALFYLKGHNHLHF